MNGTHGVGRALDVLSMHNRLKCDVIILQETSLISGHSAFTQFGYLVCCSGECGGGNGEKKGQGGVGLAVRTSIARAARPPEFVSGHLLRLHYTRLFLDPRFLLFILQNIAGYKNDIKYG